MIEFAGRGMGLGQWRIWLALGAVALGCSTPPPEQSDRPIQTDPPAVSDAASDASACAGVGQATDDIYARIRTASQVVKEDGVSRVRRDEALMREALEDYKLMVSQRPECFDARERAEAEKLNDD